MAAGARAASRTSASFDGWRSTGFPIDIAAGTSMGGLVGGAFASGMDASELAAFITSLDWDRLFDASSFAYKNIRRKVDARAYPSRLEFGLRGGIVPPTALNSGDYVELLFDRIAAPYFALDDFDDLPTPFRTVDIITIFVLSVWIAGLYFRGRSVRR